MKEAETRGDEVRFCTGNQSVSLCSRELDPGPVALAAPKMPRRLQATLAFVAVTVVSSLVALFIVALQHPRPALETYASLQDFPEDNSTGQFLKAPDYPSHFGREAELQEAIQMFKGHVENSSTWSVEIQMLTCRVDNVSSQIQMLGGHLESASAALQMVKGSLKDANTLSFQTQMLRSSLEGTTSEMKKLKGDLEETQASHSQIQSFLKSSLENTSTELHMLSRGLENANTEIQVLKAGLERANAQVRLANSSLKNVNAQILVLRGNLDSVNDLRAQQRVLRSSLEGATAEMQKLKGSLQNTNALNSQTQTFIKGSLGNTSAEIQVLRGHLERAGDEIRLLKRDLETVTAQNQTVNGRLEQTDAQMRVLKTELESAIALSSKIQVLDGLLRNASREIQTLKRGMKDAAALNSKTQMLERNLQEARAEVRRLKEDLENTKALTTKIQEEQGSLETLRAASASQEQLQRTQNQLLQLILQGWKSYSGSLYYFSHAKKTWQEAEQFCVSQGAHLASVTSEEEKAFLIRFTSASYHWIGLTDSGLQGFWRWTDGTPFNSARSSAFWDKNQPDNWRHKNGHTEDCVHMQQRWNEMYCTALYHWVCKKPMGQM
ncbi:C-type lectin domain family 4 member F [Physeter macrocephalus]|uniref:C-type lectin domain family 4 member F n=1 Tax=Physeter macrocephalus TaxID=9755 RepID=A0A2Y9TGA2_PHYMC|nr:C-type lectin domain family 4 member F [Physeter catodon]|eukprot:XP_023989243.1 C-type lectin domain family 4 member F [Physeter catodon]